MKDYAPLAATATRLIDKFGVPMTVRATDPVTAAVTNYTVRGVKAQQVKATHGQTNVQLGDWVTYFEAGVVALRAGMRVQVDGKWYTIVPDPEPIRPAELTLAYVAHLRSS